MKKQKQFEKKVYEIIKKYQQILLLNRNTFEVEYGTKDKSALMECVFNYPYLNVTIKYSDRCYEIWAKKEDITPFVVHEMCHVITDPLYSKANSRYVSIDEITDERELLTDYICNISLGIAKQYEK